MIVNLKNILSLVFMGKEIHGCNDQTLNRYLRLTDRLQIDDVVSLTNPFFICLYLLSTIILKCKKKVCKMFIEICFMSFIIIMRSMRSQNHALSCISTHTNMTMLSRLEIHVNCSADYHGFLPILSLYL